MGLLASSAASGSAPAATSVLDGLECHAYVPGVTVRGVPATFRYDDGKVVTEKRGPDDLGYQPRDLALPHYPGCRDCLGRASCGEGLQLLVHPLRQPVARSHGDRPARSATAYCLGGYTTRLVRKNWSGARQISIGQDRDFMYVLTNTDQLLRYGSPARTATPREARPGGRFGLRRIGTFEYTRSFTDDEGMRSDVFLAPPRRLGRAAGVHDPARRPDGVHPERASAPRLDRHAFGGPAGVVPEPEQRAVVRRHRRSRPGGCVRLWTDRDSHDGEGNDIFERGVLKDAWRPMAYSD